MLDPCLRPIDKMLCKFSRLMYNNLKLPYPRAKTEKNFYLKGALFKKNAVENVARK
jgi:hypothetical protein